ncbi:MAG: hypothetical protein DRP64_01435, partial [Verrucomicrobia bacterium]
MANNTADYIRNLGNSLRVSGLRNMHVQSKLPSISKRHLGTLVEWNWKECADCRFLSMKIWEKECEKV